MDLSRLAIRAGLPLAAAGVIALAVPAIAHSVDQQPAEPAAPAVVDHDEPDNPMGHQVHEQRMNQVPGMADMHEQMTGDGEPGPPGMGR